MKKLNKINQLKKVESFIQMDFVKGYKYIDRAGEIVNNFFNDGKVPKFTMGLEGLVIDRPDPKVREVKITPKSFWSHYIDPDSLDQIKSLYTKYLDFVNTIIAPEGYSRIGWRNYFIYEITTADKDGLSKKILPFSNTEFKQVAFNSKLGNLDCNFNVTIVYKNNDVNSPAILIDTDMYFESKTAMDVKTSISKLNDIESAIRGTEFLNIVNSIIKWNS